MEITVSDFLALFGVAHAPPGVVPQILAERGFSAHDWDLFCASCEYADSVCGPFQGSPEDNSTGLKEAIQFYDRHFSNARYEFLRLWEERESIYRTAKGMDGASGNG